MQTILGAGGQIATELARELNREHTGEVRIVSRNPRRISASDVLVRADLMDAEQTASAVTGSDIVYFTAGLPADTDLWERMFPTMLRNALHAARDAGAAFAYFDNTYMYPQDDRTQTEDTGFAPVGRKGDIRAQMATMVLDEMARADIPVLIARAPEFYGPGRTQSFTNSLIIDRITSGRTALIPVRDDRRRTLIWTPDAGRALSLLANTPDAYGHTWHLPVDHTRLTYRQFVDEARRVFGHARQAVLPEWLLTTAGLVSPRVRELRELLPRYRHDSLFDASKFARRFPAFKTTSYRAGLELIRSESARHG